MLTVRDAKISVLHLHIDTDKYAWLYYLILGVQDCYLFWSRCMKSNMLIKKWSFAREQCLFIF